ncbi:MAG: hypothetical protein IKO07_02860 [Clostridia bacterium]|nr:hypothetical protein [Clostridia bacterium]
MSRNKRLMALVLAALVLAAPAAAASELIAAEKIVADEVKYNTCTVERTELVKSITIGASEYYPLITTVNYKGDPALYAEILVKRGQDVKAGDPLLRVTVQYDAVQMAELELACQRAEEAFREGVEQRQEEIDALERALAAETEGYQRRVDQLNLKKQKLALEQYIYQQEYALEDKRAQIDELNARHEENVVFAPLDGVVSDLTYFREGDRLYEGTYICQISSQDVMLLAVKDGRLRYGQKVQIETGVNKERLVFKGRVVAASDCLEDVVSDYALVEIDPDEDVSGVKWRASKVLADDVRLGNVLLIDRKAVTLNGGNYIVTKLTPDGVTQKRFINQGMMTPNGTWVLQGLEEGDVVIID